MKAHCWAPYGYAVQMAKRLAALFRAIGMTAQPQNVKVACRRRRGAVRSEIANRQGA
jgi:hypothetical protein